MPLPRSGALAPKYLAPRVTSVTADESGVRKAAREGSPASAVILHYVPWVVRIKLARGERTYRIAKRVLDLGLITLSLPVLIPIVVVCVVALKLNSWNGPILYAQMRTGKDGKRFRMFKFRTMVPNADELKAGLAHLNQLQWPDFKVDNDPRVTPVGRFMRRWSVDELPQLLNVIRGQMSLIGPRPTSFAADTYEPWHRARLEALPGMTGLWQIAGRGTIEFDDRVRLDVAYIERQGLMMDLQILLRTVGAVLGDKGTT